MYNPVSSYRIQLSSSFTLYDLEKHSDYISSLGVGSIYASPVFAAVKGSSHGYDVTNPRTVNPETGSAEKLRQIARILNEKNVGWLQDIVPNHMAFHHENLWLWDLLEKGVASEYITFFDLEPGVLTGAGKLMLPLLGNDTDRAVYNREIQISWKSGGIVFAYFDNVFPANFESFRDFFRPHIDESPECFRMIWKRYELDKREADNQFLNGEWQVVKREFDSFCSTDPAMQSFTSTILGTANNSPNVIKELLDRQFYRLCHWKEAAGKINYRRFFTVNGLICLRIEDKKVLEKHHYLVKKLFEEGVFSGVRIDHIDGLLDPASYLKRLRSMLGDKAWITVEKILEKGERLPENWPVQGTTGYDFLSALNNLMVEKNGYLKLKSFWHKLTGTKPDPESIIYTSKRQVLTDSMQGELDNLFSRFIPLFEYAEEIGIVTYDEKRGVTPDKLREAIAEFMLAFRVYRHYPEEYPPDAGLIKEFGEIAEISLKRNPSLKNPLRKLHDLIKYAPTGDNRYNELLKNFLGRMMQYTGPLMAKGVEDTAMYRHNCFVAGNEVGDHLYDRGAGIEEFHLLMSQRQSDYPLTMNCTATHDTKRGEDARARLNATSDLADDWISHLREWIRLNSQLRKEIPERGETLNQIRIAPSDEEEVFIYQTIAGTLPFDGTIDDPYTKRIKEYLVKALREAKINTSWEEPDEEYENAVCRFADAILQPESKFTRSALTFHRKLAWRGVINSLTQLTVKCCAPGVPDIYRGTEEWDLSLVDPDNRKPVDMERLKKQFIQISELWHEDKAGTVSDLYKNSFDGRIKHLLTGLLLQTRSRHSELFRYGEYIPVETRGRYRNNIGGFARKHKGKWILCLFPLNTGDLSPKGTGEYFMSIRWKDTVFNLPDDTPRKYENILTGKCVSTDGILAASDVFSDLPVAVLRAASKVSGKKAGILMHVTSLPGEYGTGDFGDESFRFIDFLAQSNQAIWQTLPLSPVTRQQSWSPYSSPSAFAVSTLLVSPRHLYREGLIRRSDLDEFRFTKSSKVNYKKANDFRNSVLEKASRSLEANTGSDLYIEFEKFCRDESYWLEDYSLYTACKQIYGGRAWNRWPSKLMRREEKTMKTAMYENADLVYRQKFNQFIACRQWKKVKEYANKKGIKILGDIPFYVGWDSADVWAGQHLFRLNEKGNMLGIAGVPPDYFDKRGQLWNMPVYDWVRLGESRYEWWMKRLARNLELFDLVRLDHFRAFSAYWEVPAGERTAINGQWKRGPGVDFFRVLKEKLPGMPFVAEDLGDIDREVYDLRDEFHLPGMQVLQFGFGKDIKTSVHSPHNHKANSLVYTGTHDNNTIQGWFGKDLGTDGKKRLEYYTGKPVRRTSVNIDLIRMTHASPAKTAIIPMQDYMGLGKESRMNTPSTSRGNWTWKLKDREEYMKTCEMISKFTFMYNRC